MAQGQLEEAFSNIEACVRSSREFNGTPSVSFAVTDRERILRVVTDGHSDVFSGSLATPEHLYQIGSISKAFASVAILKLHEASRIDLHAPVTKYLPWFKLKSDIGPITLHHLMSHTAGLVMGSDATPAGLSEAWALRETEPSTAPESFFHYSNSGYKIVGLVLEEIHGKPQGAVIREEVLAPLGMGSTSAVISNDIQARCAVGHMQALDDRPWTKGAPLSHAPWFESDTADGSICSTPDDMCRYLRMLLNRGRGPRGRLISDESFRLLTQRVIQPDDALHGEFYGYGLNVETIDGHDCIGHSGGMVGYCSNMLLDMDAGLGAIVLMNGPGKPEEISRYAVHSVRASLEGGEALPAPARPDLSHVENALDYVGTYGDGADALNVVAKDSRLFLERGDSTIGLSRYLLEEEKDVFIADDQAFALFPLRFGRKDGRVVELIHGPDWFPGKDYDGPTAFKHPRDWSAHVGHYRSHNPWLTNFRVVLRTGMLVLVMPSGSEEPLVPLSDGLFRVGSDDRSPEYIRFDTVLRGKSTGANLSGSPYYRIFTP